MDRKQLWRVFNFAGIALIVLALGTATVFAQGKGRGGGVGGGRAQEAEAASVVHQPVLVSIGSGQRI